jgi:hypothetical protein
MKKVSIVLALAAAVVALPAAAAARPATTDPVTITEVGVTLGLKAVALTPPSVDRGSTVRFTIKNGTKAVRYFAIGGRVTHALKPKQTQVFFLILDYRGAIPYRSWGSTKHAPVVKGSFNVT